MINYAHHQVELQIRRTDKHLNKRIASGCQRSSVMTLQFVHADNNDATDNDNADFTVITVSRIFLFKKIDTLNAM